MKKITFFLSLFSIYGSYGAKKDIFQSQKNNRDFKSHIKMPPMLEKWMNDFLEFHVLPLRDDRGKDKQNKEWMEKKINKNIDQILDKNCDNSPEGKAHNMTGKNYFYQYFMWKILEKVALEKTISLPKVEEIFHDPKVKDLMLNEQMNMIVLKINQKTINHLSLSELKLFFNYLENHRAKIDKEFSGQLKYSFTLLSALFHNVQKLCFLSGFSKKLENITLFTLYQTLNFYFRHCMSNPKGIYDLRVGNIFNIILFVMNKIYTLDRGTFNFIKENIDEKMHSDIMMLRHEESFEQETIDSFKVARKKDFLDIFGASYRAEQKDKDYNISMSNNIIYQHIMWKIFEIIAIKNNIALPQENDVLCHEAINILEENRIMQWIVNQIYSQKLYRLCPNALKDYFDLWNIDFSNVYGNSKQELLGSSSLLMAINNNFKKLMAFYKISEDLQDIAMMSFYSAIQEGRYKDKLRPVYDISLWDVFYYMNYIKDKICEVQKKKTT